MGKMKKLILLAMVLLLLLSIFNITFAGQISAGMTKKQVIKNCGEPVNKEINGPYEKWIYKWAGNLIDEVYFKNGEVEKIVRWACDDKGRLLRIVDINIR